MQAYQSPYIGGSTPSANPFAGYYPSNTYGVLSQSYGKFCWSWENVKRNKWQQVKDMSIPHDWVVGVFNVLYSLKRDAFFNITNDGGSVEEFNLTIECCDF